MCRKLRMSGGGERWYAEKRMLVVITNIWRGKPSRGTSQPVPSCRRGLKIPQTQDSRGSTHTSINKRTPVTSGPTGCKTSFFQGFLIHALETEAIHRGESLEPDEGFEGRRCFAILALPSIRAEVEFQEFGPFPIKHWMTSRGVCLTASTSRCPTRRIDTSGR
ncbi:unnamed protein product [Nesidiocoris tenuis]|uniref:Uncharacterized protein n=1 Tax=Nesidiocoris tenuis TaxID=355587 RepID=A0A6H5G1H2_9HEMI|nr:unnamed protein product [Nesidiocoris tenuis]